MRNALFLFWFLVTCSDAVGVIIAALKARRRPGRYAQLLCGALYGLAVEAVIAAGSLLLFYQNESEVAPAFMVARLIGRSIKCVTVWRLALWLLGITNGEATETQVNQLSGALPPVYWREQMLKANRDAIRAEVKPEFLQG